MENKLYHVFVTKELEIEAENKKDAIEKVKNLFKDNEITIRTAEYC